MWMVQRMRAAMRVKVPDRPEAVNNFPIVSEAFGVSVLVCRDDRRR